MRHTVTIAEVEEYVRRTDWERVATSGGNGSHKRLEHNHHGAYRVTDHYKIVYEGGNVEKAVAAYNDAP